jgi:hypothetical protein
MTMMNTLTDRLDLVKIEDAKGFLRLFSRNRSSSDGFCLVVFRKESYLGSIISDEVITENDLKRRCERIGVRDGDSILRINMGPRPMTLNERLTTQDGYVRPYKLEIEIHVSDPRTFAQRYRQSSDPVNLARLAIEGYLQRYATRNMHDDLEEDTLRNYARQALNDGSNRSFGLAVTVAHKLTLQMDPIRVKELEIIQKGRLEEQRIREEARVKQIEVQESTEVQKEEVRGSSEVERLRTESNQSLQSAIADYERAEDEKRKQYEMQMESYLLRERNKQHDIVRVDEVKGREHQNVLEGVLKDHLRLEAGKDNISRRNEETREDEHIAVRNQFKIEQASQQRKLTRVDEIDEQRHKLIVNALVQAANRQQVLLDNVGARAIEALGDRIGDSIDGGGNLSTVLSEVLGDYPELRDIFLAPDKVGLGSGEQKLLQIEDATLPSEESRQTPSTEQTRQTPSTGQNSASSARGSMPIEKAPVAPSSTRQNDMPGGPVNMREPMPHMASNPQDMRTLPSNLQDTRTLPGNLQDTGTLPGILREQDYTINITDLGITLLQVELTEGQREIAWTATSTAFMVSAISETGPTRNTQLAVGDIVVEINGQEIDNAQSISYILRSYRPGAAVALSVLRGESLERVEVRSIK